VPSGGTHPGRRATSDQTPLLRLRCAMAGTPGAEYFILQGNAVLLMTASLVIVTTVTEKDVDFLPGGGTQKGADASQALSHQIQQKKRSLLKKTVPKQRLVSSSPDAVFNLPDAPPDLLNVPDVSSLIGSGGKIGGGGMGHGGLDAVNGGDPDPHFLGRLVDA